MRFSLRWAGAGKVYRARDTRLDRKVAIKVLPSQLCSDPDLKHPFEREARITPSLNHPHICHLYDVGAPLPDCLILTRHLSAREPISCASGLERLAVVPT